MDGKPLSITSSDHYVPPDAGCARACAALMRIMAASTIAAAMLASLHAVRAQTAIDFAANQVGMPPADFTFGISGAGQPGKWMIVRDPTASQGVALEQFSDDPTDNRFDYAVYRSLALKNLILSTRFKLVTGTMRSAGLVVRWQDANNYYVARANALEQRVDLFRMTHGELKRVTGTDGDVVMNYWQTLKVAVSRNEFVVSLDGKALFTAWDRTLPNEGGVGLWTQEDSRTRSINSTSLRFLGRATRELALGKPPPATIGRASILRM